MAQENEPHCEIDCDPQRSKVTDRRDLLNFTLSLLFPPAERDKEAIPGEFASLKEVQYIIWKVIVSIGPPVNRWRWWAFSFGYIR